MVRVDKEDLGGQSSVETRKTYWGEKYHHHTILTDSNGMNSTEDTAITFALVEGGISHFRVCFRSSFSERGDVEFWGGSIYLHKAIESIFENLLLLHQDSN